MSSNRTLQAAVNAIHNVDKRLTSARHTAVVKVMAALEDGHRQAVIAAESGKSAGTISNYVTAGKALALIPDPSKSDVHNIIATAFGESGDRAALKSALKSDDGAGVAAAVTADKPEGKGKGASKGKGTSQTLTDMTVADLIALAQDALRAAADKSHGKDADLFLATADLARTFGRNLSKVPA